MNRFNTFSTEPLSQKIQKSVKKLKAEPFAKRNFLVGLLQKIIHKIANQQVKTNHKIMQFINFMQNYIFVWFYGFLKGPIDQARESFVWRKYFKILPKNIFMAFSGINRISRKG